MNLKTFLLVVLLSPVASLLLAASMLYLFTEVLYPTPAPPNEIIIDEDSFIGPPTR